MRIRLLVSLLVALAAMPLLAQQTTTVSLDCWSGGWCALPCGGSGQGNYACSNGMGAWTPTCGFNDPLPQGSKVTKIVAIIQTHQCDTSSSWTATVNGQAISTITDATQSCSCLSSPCLGETHTSADYPDGFPGYVYGGANTFGIALASGLICVEHVALTLTYSSTVANITATEPVIPRNSGVVGGCVQYRSDLTAVLTKAGQPVQGVNVTYRSDRGTPPDTFVQPRQATDATGTATGGNVTTRRQGTARISVANQDVSTPNPAAINFQQANWEDQFFMTGYILANEADFGGQTVTNPCGLQGTWVRGFLYGNGVLMQGSGQDHNGNIITIDWANSGRPLNQNNVCFTVTDCPHTASGDCVAAGTTIAVDPGVIPMGANVDIQNVGARTAQDTGGRINGYHIDVFRGFGRAAMQGWGNFHGTVRYLGGGGQCAN